MKIAFLNPNFSDERASDALQPLVYALLKALTPPGIATIFHDERVERLPLETLEADLVALSVQTFTARRAYAIADRLRSRGHRVVLGGFHPTLAPEEAAEHADAVVAGDAEPVWRRVVEDARAGRLAPLYRGEVTAPLGGVVPDRSIFAGKPYMPVAPVQFGRGCRFACDFCSVKAFYGSTLRQRPVDEVVGEIRALGARLLFFVDDNLFVTPERTGALLEAIRPLGVRWACQISMDVTLDESLLRRMRESGCVLAYVGFESLEPENLRVMHKTANTRLRDASDAVARFRRAGIMVGAAFVFGYDHDSPGAIDETLRFALVERLALAHFNTAMPTPATPLYHRLEAEGRMRYGGRWWLHPEFRYGEAMFEPRALAARELGDRCFAARRAFNTRRSVLRRALDPRANSRTLFNLRLFLLLNRMNRNELHRKQGLRLG